MINKLVLITKIEIILFNTLKVDLKGVKIFSKNLLTNKLKV